MLVFDCETNGLLDELTTIHCLGVRDIEGGQRWMFVGADVEKGLHLLEDHTKIGEQIAGHNVLNFDLPALKKVYPAFAPVMDRVFDTMCATRLIWTDLKDIDRKLIQQKRMPAQNVFRPHALETWGYRLKLLKGEYEGDTRIADEDERKRTKWDACNPDMLKYCEQDVDVTCALLARIQKEAYAQQALDLEMATQVIITRQVHYGVGFNEKAAQALHVTLLKEKLALEADLKAQFKPFYMRDGGEDFTPKRDVAKLGYVGGAPLCKVKLVEFNPGSRDHISNRLIKLFSWEPLEFTGDGKPKIDDTVMNTLTYPQTKPLQRYLMIDKRIGQLAEGKEAWLKNVKANGRIHGSVNSNGAVTGRMTHAHPNLGQTPATYSPFGTECRALFVAADGKVLVGIDASALELCGLAGYMGAFDGGAYIHTVLEGSKADGTDIHSTNAHAIGLDPRVVYLSGTTGRDIAKTWFYAFIYGAGDEKLGAILTGKSGVVATKAGKKSRKAFMVNLPALGKLVERIKEAIQKRGYLIGLDGRLLHIRSAHAALNTLLQSAGAVLMKKALVLLDTSLQGLGLIPGKDYEFVLNVHDEWQIECNENLGEQIGQMGIESIRLAGEHFGFRCPLSGEFSVGRNWAETH